MILASTYYKNTPCPNCTAPLVTGTGRQGSRSHRDFYHCKSGCGKIYHLDEPEPGLFLYLDSDELLDYLLNLLWKNPSTTSEELDNALKTEQISVEEFDLFVFQIRSDAKAIKLDLTETKEVPWLYLFRKFLIRHEPLPINEIPVLLELADLMEKRYKAWKPAADARAAAIKEFKMAEQYHASKAPLIEYVAQLLWENPSFSGEYLKKELDARGIAVEGLHSSIATIKREANLLQQDQTVSLLFPVDHIPALAQLADLVEKKIEEKAREEKEEKARKKTKKSLEADEDDEDENEDEDEAKVSKKGRKKTPSRQVKATKSLDLLKRYKDGKQEEVWQQLLELGQAFQEEPLHAQVKQVVDETMKRVRKNVELLYRRLQEIDFHFDKKTDWWQMDPFVAPPDDVATELEKIEKTIGVLPLSLRSFCEHVGSVRFLGRHEEIECDYQDILFVDVFSLIWDEFDQWEADWEEDGEPFRVPLAIDFSQSGLPPGIEVPNSCVDAKIWPGETFFVEYLRDSLHWGGFPGLRERFETPPPIIQRLKDGMIGF